MAFPTTRRTLIERLVIHGRDEDWQAFLYDYWRPLCRFAARWGRLGTEDAEDVASMALQAILHGRLLERWAANPSAKMRSLLCTVVRNVLSNRLRVETGRQHLLQQDYERIVRSASVHAESEPAADPELFDAFYTAWAEELMQDAADQLLNAYLREGRGDYYRVLYGRICEEMTFPQIAESLKLKLSTVDNYFRHARDRLGAQLERMLREQIDRYSPPGIAEAEFHSEWERLRQFLEERGGLERVLRRSYLDFDAAAARRHESESVTTILRSLDRRASDASAT